MILKIEKLDHQGRGIAHADGKIVFVENALPEETVDVEVIIEKPKYKEAIVKEYIKKSSSRTKSKCPYYEECGGCQLRHMSYDDTLNFKKNKLKEILIKYANLSCDTGVIKNPQRDFYRNKIELHIKDGVAGFYKKCSHELVETDRCINAEEAINTVMRSLDFFHLQNAHMTIKCNYNGEVIIEIESEEEPHIEVEKLRDKMKLVGIVYNKELYFGSDHYMEIVDGLLFKETYNSFFQVNRHINEEIFKLLKSHIKPNSVVLDMCSGVGTLSIVASTKAKTVYGIEIIDNAVKDALVNAKMNKIENVNFLLGDAFENIKKIADRIDAIIVDPPRSGISKEGIENILSISPEKIIYISCDPVTLARDIKLLEEKYSVEKIYLLDMFSYTYHIESFCILNKR